MKNAATKVKAMGLFVLNGGPWSPQALTRSAGSPISGCWAARSKPEIAFIRRAHSGAAEWPVPLFPPTDYTRLLQPAGLFDRSRLGTP